VLHGRTGDYGEALAVLNRMAENAGRSLGANELLEKGRLLDRLGRYREAFAAFAEGKRLCREEGGLVYQAEAARQLVDRLKGFFTEGRMRVLPRAGARNDFAQPIFILGFPRSGTTLVEQILSAYPRIAAGDELSFVTDIAQTLQRGLNSPLGYPEALAELWMGDRRHGLDELRNTYLEAVRRQGVIGPDAGWLTDKMPLNETHLGLCAGLGCRCLNPRGPASAGRREEPPQSPAKGKEKRRRKRRDRSPPGPFSPSVAAGPAPPGAANEQEHREESEELDQPVGGGHSRHPRMAETAR
jgi:Sulfotransferase family